MNDLKVEYVDIDTLKEYERNAKLHPQEQIEQIKNSIQQFNMIDPIGVWKDNSIIEGNGRYKACKQLGIKKVPVIRLDHLTDEERKAYTLAHNKLTMNTDFDLNILNIELDDIQNINMEDFGFNLNFNNLEEMEEENPYTAKVDIPQYEITGEEPKINELIDEEKTRELIDEIKNSNVTDEQKEFLIKAAQRHLGFNYSKVAEYYAHQDKEMQELMEKSALVIIDFEDAIKNGYIEFKKNLEELVLDDEDYEE